MDRRSFLAGATVEPPRRAAGRGGAAADEGLSDRPSRRLSADQPGGRARLGAFFQGLRELGYVEGQNIVIEGRWYGDNLERLPALAAELVRLQVDVIVAGAAPAPGGGQARHIHDSHRRGEPFRSGRERARGQPRETGGQRHGPVPTRCAELRGKQLELLKEVVPGLHRVAVLTNPDIAGPRARRERAGARGAGPGGSGFTSWRRGLRARSPMRSRRRRRNGPAPSSSFGAGRCSSRIEPGSRSWRPGAACQRCIR